MEAYATAKYAVRGLTDSLRMTLAPHGIGVSCLFPGATRTQLVPVPAEDFDPEPSDDLFNAELARDFFAAMREAMDPMEMGATVVHAIKENLPHICTHVEFLDEVRERNRALEAAFPADQKPSPARIKFETGRREASTALLTMAAKD